MLAYVFWHAPREGTDPDAYEDALIAFHGALHEAPHETPPQGLRMSAVYRHYALPWAPPSMFVYEDWYLVDSFAALGTLNAAAVSGSRRPSHDAAARASSWGAGGVYASRGDDATTAGHFTYWISKPGGMDYESFYDTLRASSGVETGVWQRQLVLGPAAEFCIRTASRLDLDELDPFESASHTVYTGASITGE
ncbi:MAG: hypothetical protein WD021_06680 [Rhodothermales bacterium]